MTLLLHDLPGAPAVPPSGLRVSAAEALGWLERGIDGLAGQVTGVDPEVTMAAVERAIRRLQAVKLSLVARADEQQVAARTGMSDTGAWLAKRTQAGAAKAAGEVRLATALATNPAAPGPAEGADSRNGAGCVAGEVPRRPAAQALGDGALSPDHARVIVAAIEQLPAGLTPEQIATVESDLVVKAERFSADQLRRVARRALEAVEPDQTAVDAHEDGLLADEEAQAYERARLTLHDNHDGTVTGHFTVPSLQGELLRKILQAMTAPRRAKFAAAQAQSGRTPGRIDWDRARGEAFCELIEHLPTDRLHTKTTATILVTIDEDTLREKLKAASLDTGSDLSSGQARRLACGAGILPAVLNGSSLPLDLGRANRFFSETQRTALAVKHSSCAAAGCERPFAWCELHHRQPWSHGGSTDLSDAIPLCWFHHRRIHDPAYLHRHGPDGITFHQRRQ